MRGGGRQTEHRKSACGEDRRGGVALQMLLSVIVGRVLDEYRNALKL